ncbi:MAG: tetratricopeptide repeat protein [Methylococcales bacterium]|nr:tetratricopeptide repeat protein [Methylococcales bacterium]
MLASHPRTQLCLMLKQYGQIIMTDPKRCKALLSDLASEHRLETYLLITALEQKITDDLLKPNHLMPINIRLERLTQSLRDAIGIEEEYAYWAVESWALALGVIDNPLPTAIPTPPALPIAPTILLPPSTTAIPPKRARRLPTNVLFIAGILAGIFVVTVLTFSAKTHSKNTMTKPPVTAELSITAEPVDAEPSDPWTQNNLGDLYYDGRGGVAVDYQQAAQWYRKAAEQGSIAGQCNLGFMYANGYGVTKDYRLVAPE